MGGTLPRLRDARHPLYKLEHPAELKPGEYSQPEAKVFRPPGTQIWKSPVMGSWGLSDPPHRKHIEPWVKHGSTFEALKRLLRFAWTQYFADHGGLPNSDCPIRGIFGF